MDKRQDIFIQFIDQKLALFFFLLHRCVVSGFQSGSENHQWLTCKRPEIDSSGLLRIRLCRHYFEDGQFKLLLLTPLFRWFVTGPWECLGRGVCVSLSRSIEAPGTGCRFRLCHQVGLKAEKSIPCLQNTSCGLVGSSLWWQLWIPLPKGVQSSEVLVSARLISAVQESLWFLSSWG